ncbi:MAG: hypothetical protein M0C28_28725 [Candidatus Moduliflexus flocculans]|nr:hypothetical protein [Candidatus Moduliflexus flocculans]
MTDRFVVTAGGDADEDPLADDEHIASVQGGGFADEKQFGERGQGLGDGFGLGFP